MFHFPGTSKIIHRGAHLIEAGHDFRHARKYSPDKLNSRLVKMLIVLVVTLTLWNIPTDWYGIQGLTIVQQRIIAIFAFATLMWIMEIVSSWATSVAVIGMMLLFTSDSGIKWMCDPTGTLD